MINGFKEECGILVALTALSMFAISSVPQQLHRGIWLLPIGFLFHSARLSFVAPLLSLVWICLHYGLESHVVLSLLPFFYALAVHDKVKKRLFSNKFVERLLPKGNDLDMRHLVIAFACASALILTALGAEHCTVVVGHADFFCQLTFVIHTLPTPCITYLLLVDLLSLPSLPPESAGYIMYIGRIFSLRVGEATVDWHREWRNMCVFHCIYWVGIVTLIHIETKSVFRLAFTTIVANSIPHLIVAVFCETKDTLKQLQLNSTSKLLQDLDIHLFQELGFAMLRNESFSKDLATAAGMSSCKVKNVQENCVASFNEMCVAGLTIERLIEISEKHKLLELAEKLRKWREN